MGEKQLQALANELFKKKYVSPSPGYVVWLQQCVQPVPFSPD